jgi:hypothetical protein
MNSPRMLWQVEAKAAEVLTQQMLDRFERQTFVGGKASPSRSCPGCRKRPRPLCNA